MTAGPTLEPIPGILWDLCPPCATGLHECTGTANAAAPEKDRRPCECQPCATPNW